MHSFKYKSWTICGSSIASDQTCLLIKELGVCFDMGFTFPDCVKKGRIVLISHAHADHIGSLHLHIRKRLRNKLPSATYVIPRVCREPLSQLYSAVCAMDDGVSTTTAPHLDGVNLLVAEDTPTVHINDNMFIRSFDVTHKIPAKGYIIYEKRRKIKPEYNTIEWFGSKLAQFRKDNPDVAIDDIVNEPMIGFSGDTTIEGVLQNEDLLKCKLLLLECTYIGTDEITVQQAKDRGHIHIDEIKQHWERFTNEKVLLIHPSPRYTIANIRSARNALSGNMRDRVDFLDGYPSNPLVM